MFGCIAATRSHAASAACSAIDISLLPKLTQRVFWSNLLTSFSFSWHSFVVFARSAFSCSVNMTSSVSSSASRSAIRPASSSSFASMTFSPSALSLLKLSLSSSSDMSVCDRVILLTRRENTLLAVVLSSFNCSTDFPAS